SIITVKVVGLQLLATYYVKVEGARSDVFGVGGYRLSVSYVPWLDGAIGTVSDALNTVVNSAATFLAHNDFHTDDTPATAVNLQQLYAANNNHFDYGFGGAISDRTDVDFCRVQAPPAVSGKVTVLTAT